MNLHRPVPRLEEIQLAGATTIGGVHAGAAIRIGGPILGGILSVAGVVLGIQGRNVAAGAMLATGIIVSAIGTAAQVFQAEASAGRLQ